MQDYLNGLDEEVWSCITGKSTPPPNVQAIGSSSETSSVTDQTDRLHNLEKWCMRELCGALPPVVIIMSEVVQLLKTSGTISKKSFKEFRRLRSCWINV